MDFKDFIYFEAVARFGNITRAADYLNMSQPPLSHKLKSFESEIGIKLFERHKKGVQITNEGKLLLQRINPLLKQYNEVLDYIHDTENLKIGNFTIATLPSFGGELSNALSKIWSENTDIHFTIIEGHANNVKNAVQSGHAQLGVTRLPINDPEINYTILGNDPIMAIVNKKDPLISKDIITPSDLKGKPICLIRGDTPFGSYIQITQMLEELKIKPNIIAETETSSTLVQLVKNGLGLGLLPKSGLNLVPDNLKPIPFAESEITVPVAIIWLKNESNSAVLKLKDLISDKISQSLIK